MGWPKFEAWCRDNVEGGESAVDVMALHYRDLREESTAHEAGRLSTAQVVQLDHTSQAITRWLFARCAAASAHQGATLYSHQGARLTAELADLKYECVQDWGHSADNPGGYWPQSYQDMATPPLSTDSPSLKKALDKEETALQEACKQVRKLPAAARQRMQQFMNEVSERVRPKAKPGG